VPGTNQATSGLDRFDAIPTTFEPNVGQADSRAAFVARGSGYLALLSDKGATFAFGSASRPEATARATGASGLRMRLDGTHGNRRLVGEDEQVGRTNYLASSDPTEWRTNVPTYAAVRHEAAYDGVDVVYYGTGSDFEFDFVVAPGADASQIRMAFEGQASASSDADGNVVLRLASGEARLGRAVAYQRSERGDRIVASGLAVEPDGNVRIDLGAYDRTLPLVVDPVLRYVDYFGGSQSYDRGTAIAVDASGAVYVAGSTDAFDFPTTAGAFDATSNTGYIHYAAADAFVAKLSADGASLVYSTYLGGLNTDSLARIAVDGSGRVTVVGWTYSDDFPTTAGALDTTLGGGEDAFLARLDAAGSALVYSTYLGGSSDDYATGVALDASGNAYVAGRTTSTDFPTSPSAFDGSLGGVSDGFVTKVNAAGAAVYSTYLGGSEVDEVHAIAVDGSGVAHVTGSTYSADFPMTAHGYDQTYADDWDAFVTSVAANGQSLATSTFLGGDGEDWPTAIAVTTGGQAYVAGHTGSPTFPTTLFAFDRTYNTGGSDAFVTCVSANALQLVYSSFLGGGDEDECRAVMLDAAGDAYVAGVTRSSDFPTTAGAFQTTGASQQHDGFVTKVSPDGRTMAVSTRLGGTGDDEAVDAAMSASGSIFVAGGTTSSDFPTTAGAFDRTFNGSSDAFVTKLDAGLSSATFSTLISGGTSVLGQLDETANGVATDASGDGYVTGSTQSFNFPTTAGVYDPSYNGSNINTSRNAYVAKFGPDGALVWSTYLGFGSSAGGTAIAVDAAGAVFVSGYGFVPTTPGAFQANSFGSTTTYVTKLTPDGAALIYSTYIDTTFGSYPYDIAIDAAGNAYVAGNTINAGYPVTPNAFDTSYNGGNYGDAFVTKLNATGTALVYSTFLGGESGETAESIAVDASGAAYVTGGTGSTTFPTTPGALLPTLTRSGDAFVTKLDPSGSSLVYSTFLGGNEMYDSDWATGIAVDASGNAYVTGWTGSTDFPLTPGAYDSDPGDDIVFEASFVSKLNPSGSALVYSTLVDGPGSTDHPSAIALGPNGEAFVVGATRTGEYPLTPDAYSMYPGPYPFDIVYLTKLTANGDALAYSTFLGRGIVKDVAVDASGVAYLVGDQTAVDVPGEFLGVRDSKNAFLIKLRPPTPGTDGSDTPGIYSSSTGAWFLKNTSGGGSADVTYSFGAGGGPVPLAGDWDGDGDDTPGLYDPATGAFFLKNTNAGGPADIVFSFGAGGRIPLTGDWDGDGVDTIGLYDAATGAFFLRNSNSPGAADVVFAFGAGGAGLTPIVGDWNGDGIDTAGLYVGATGTFFLKNANEPGAADLSFAYGPAGATPLTGDWNGDGVDTVAVYVGSSGAWFLRNSNTPGAGDVAFIYGPPGVVPIKGNWDGL
jgi:hypothetical protein